MFTCSKERMAEKVRVFSRFGATGNGGITRLALTPELLAARKEFCLRCEKLGMNIVTDDMCNVYATLPGREDQPAIAMGSHLDSVIRGGNYDGVLGVLTALEVVETLVSEKLETRHPITLIVWTNEEGVRFPPSMTGSGIVCGKFDKDRCLAVKDMEGVSYGHALEDSGYIGDINNRLALGKQAAYLELHVEQGPVLDSEGLTIGIVEGIVGMTNHTFVVSGQAGHAGTVPMKMRRDALYAASQIICMLHERIPAINPEIVFTTGHMEVEPNVHSITPGRVSFTFDGRHRDPVMMQKIWDVLDSIPDTVAGCTIERREHWSREPIRFHDPFVEVVEKNVAKFGYPSKRMYSGAGHDAQYVSSVLPSAMVFVPSIGGHSHCEIEKTLDEDCWKGANILLNTLLDIDAMI